MHLEARYPNHVARAEVGLLWVVVSKIAIMMSLRKGARFPQLRQSAAAINERPSTAANVG